MDSSLVEGGLNVTLTIRLLMYGKEVGSIIGKKGESGKKMREESGTHINISDGNCPERIITLGGTTTSIFKTFSMIIEKLEEDISTSMTNSTATSKPPVTMRLVVPASQCGTLIGKGGGKIKEFKESAGAAQLNRTCHHGRFAMGDPLSAIMSNASPNTPPDQPGSQPIASIPPASQQACCPLLLMLVFGNPLHLEDEKDVGTE
nr:poly(rC)-binding protein 2-like [Syngnathus scovelli]